MLDANVIIECHRLGVWDRLRTGYEILVPSIVFDDEARYFKSSTGRQDICLTEDSTLSRVEASAQQMAELFSRFTPDFRDSLDPGEAEALALLLADKVPGAVFCTSDGPAIKALSMLGKPEAGMSLKSILDAIGSRTNLKPQYGDEFFRRMIEDGKQRRIMGTGIKSR